ncbi:hypothetical protein V6N12_012653 [Hibiscus sabdariffa]|uniref:Uncharacterized protein n=1 Tax=Hibiscus sabdariffa TaxID=183260 RepID=A0ABR2DD47_9ROSI
MECWELNTIFVANHEKFHAEADKHYWKAIAELIPNEMPTTEKRGKKDKEKEKKPSTVVVQGPKLGKPTDLSRMRQILLELKHETPLHLKHSPPAPEQVQDAKSGNSSVPPAAPVTSNRICRNCCLNSFLSTFISYKDKEKKPSIVVAQGPKSGKPTDLSTIRQILLELKHETPLHQNHSPPAPEQAQDAKSGNSSVPAAAPVTSNRRGRKPTDLSRMRQILLELKHETPLHLKHSPPAPEQVQDAKSGNSYVPSAAPVTSNRRGRKPTDLSRMRQILLELKHETPLHFNHSPPAPEQVQDAKFGNSSVPAAAPVTCNHRGRNCCLNSFVSTFICYKTTSCY